ncbi:hypothetical protein BDM02DRAFT_3121550 [Thelephora ganbajun]|uniref:Uncharacterized protein n=1 Tax=Thelephora ganbajun TaxID=370292 RepID=A0ACB6Z4T4_THEGA|nr:hypothetical protein BDM02DRAFT_3121550 [Thelephora ganbajun]
MGVLQDETFSDALKLALSAGMLPPLMPYTFAGQMPIIFLAPPTCYDFMNHTTTKPFTISNPFLSIPGSIKTLRPSYVAIPLYTIIPLHTLQTQVSPPQSIPSPRPLDSAFWDVVERTVEHSVHGATALVQFFSGITKATPEKDLALLRDDQQLSSCESLDLSSLPSIPTEDDLLRMDMAELESIPSSELYLGERGSKTALPTAPRLLSSKTQPSRPPRSSSSDATLANLQEGYLLGEDLSILLQIPDDELYFNVEDLNELDATPPWPFNSLVAAISTFPPA